MIHHLQNHFQKDDYSLFVQGWFPDSPKATVNIVHGFGEHSGRYEEIGRFLAEQGYAVIAHDQVGHGLSEGARGYTPSYNFLLEALQKALRISEEKFPNIPHFLYGHSMGANIVTNYLLEKKASDIRGAILTSAFFLPGQEIEKLSFLVPLVRWIWKIFPNFYIGANLKPHLVARDPEEAKKYASDPLVHNKMYARIYLPMLDKGEFAIENANKLQIPLLIIHGTEDKIANPEGSKKFIKNASREKITYKSWENGFHEIQHEPMETRMLFFAEVRNWLDKQLNIETQNVL